MAWKWEELDRWNRIENKHSKEQLLGKDNMGMKPKEK